MQQTSRKRIVAIDYGAARIGLAISDEMRIIASPLANLLAHKELQKTVQIVVEELTRLEKEKKYCIGEIVVGLPLKMDGSDSKTTETVRLFAKELQKLIAWPVTLFDERLTSIQADRALMTGNFSRKKRAQFVDRISAVILLQSYLARTSHG